ncbi:MAG: sporulation protein YabP [Ruminococcaceae bacterium]|nr:sporulation protein YabP [Oscillospiraceae bacterium]
MDEKKLKMPHNLVMEDRKVLSITGVSDVDSFDESTIIVFTDIGELTVRGSDLHIRNLNIEAGEVSLEGKISSLTYADTMPKQAGFFSRVFR